MWPQGLNSKELTVTYTRSGACGLIRHTAKNLTNFCIRFQTARLDDVFTVVSFKRMLRNCKCFLYPTLHIKPLWISTKLTIFHISVPTTRAAWLSSVRAARCEVNSSNERNPYN